MKILCNLLQVRLFPNRKITMIMDMQETGISQMVSIAPMI